jgi:hypothetical protein
MRKESLPMQSEPRLLRPGSEELILVIKNKVNGPVIEWQAIWPFNLNGSGGTDQRFMMR